MANCFPGPYLSDHCTVETVLTQNREDMLRKSVTNRKLHNIDQQQFITDLNLQDLNLMQQPDEFVNAFEDWVQKALDKHAPERMKEITIRSTNPWFTNEVKDKRKQLEEERKYGKNISIQNIGEHFKWQEKNIKSYWPKLKQQRVKRKLMTVKRHQETVQISSLSHRDCNWKSITTRKNW